MSKNIPIDTKVRPVCTVHVKCREKRGTVVAHRDKNRYSHQVKWDDGTTDWYTMNGLEEL